MIGQVLKKNSYIYPRNELMITIVLIGYTDIDTLELIFGRSEKTIYRELKNAKQTIISNGHELPTIQLYLNKSFIHLKSDNIKLTKAEIIQKVEVQISKIFETKIDLHQLQLANELNNKSFFPTNAQKALVVNLYHQLKVVLSGNLNVTFESVDEQLIINHLSRNLLIYQYGVDDHVVIDDSIFSSYNLDYDLIKLLISSVFHEYNLLINESNISYLVTYLLPALAQPIKRIKIICPIGVASSQIVKLTIENYFIDQVVEDDYDFCIVIGNSQLVDSDNIIKIDTINKNQLVQTLSEYLTLKAEVKLEIFNLFTNLADLLQANVTYRQFTKQVLISRNKIIQRSPMLRELLTEKTIAFPKKLKDWKGAVIYGNEILVKNGFTDEQYGQEMIAAIEQYGPYVVLAPKFAMPHAKSKHVKRTGMSLLILDEPIYFPEEKEVNVILTLCSNDNQNHLEALSELTTFLTKHNFLTDLSNCNNAESVINLLEEKWKKL